jgi:hypothetical protein
MGDLRRKKIDDVRRKRGGTCGSDYLQTDATSYMILDEAVIAKQEAQYKGGVLKRRNEEDRRRLLRRGGQPPLVNDKLRRKRGGMCGSDYLQTDATSYMLINDAIQQPSSTSQAQSGGFLRRRRDEEDKRRLLRRGGDGTAPPPSQSTDYLKSAMNITGAVGSAFNPEALKGMLGQSQGGCGFNNKKDCKKHVKGGTALIELAPFISTLVLLGLRIGNDKAAQRDLTDTLSKMVTPSSLRRKTKSMKN